MGVGGVFVVPWVLYGGTNKATPDERRRALERYRRELVAPLRG